MRKVILLLLVLLIGLFTSIIVVDERQNVVIRNYKGTQTILKVGVHLTIPVLDKVSYVYINERTSLLTLSLNESIVSNEPIQLEVLINYHVINPIDYLLAVDKYDKVGISEIIAKSLTFDIKQTIATETLAKFNQQPVFSIRQDEYKSLGIAIDKVSLLSIKYIPDAQLNAVGAKL
jgi:regulator of protease activity HflC (stomatin/prohibitin superfamily)